MGIMKEGMPYLWVEVTRPTTNHPNTLTQIQTTVILLLSVVRISLSTTDQV
jgi:hypothetical protein